jgi:exodeoxyribonuclease III
MKITTWNVNGIRSAMNKGLRDWIQAGFSDVICLQEIKARPEQLAAEDITYPYYQTFWHPGMRPGYSGVSVFSRAKPLQVQIGMGIDKFDQEGRLIRIKYPGFTLFNGYFPNGQRDQDRLNYKLDFYSSLLDICNRLKEEGEKIIITGDFNTAHNEIDLANPKENSKNSGFLPEERVWVDRYLENGFVDVFRQKYPEKVQYTWWTYRLNARKRNIGWRLDYFLTSQNLVNQVEDIITHDEVTGSDHCPVTLLLKED